LGHWNFDLSVGGNGTFDMNAKKILNVTFVRVEATIISKSFDEVINYGVTVFEIQQSSV
jgi:hypothetical protein